MKRSADIIGDTRLAVGAAASAGSSRASTAAATSSRSHSGTIATSIRPARKVFTQSATPPGSGVGRGISSARMSVEAGEP